MVNAKIAVTHMKLLYNQIISSKDPRVVTIAQEILIGYATTLVVGVTIGVIIGVMI